ncbi:MAG: alpha-1,4-glucan--maltose-1-phosphate maltosyltransferase [Proteobacteria bacterium]|nr:alpha-1,4-glucan--maltose-1-phosphate maltosyltransferase [Pseudomonadota bacterium]MBU4297596.1 alpha-1,4-glucan--maltose-1-phosphate maltosyltransferase [Pseudomonadota bacterium]MCG2750041.1 alpha-1,4-glucan--maltose-1-phosphate maltosyltransferase [Desulfobulbaceae bacterium]
MDHAAQHGKIDPNIARRVWIENVQPTVDAGRFPIKRCVGEDVLVTADIFADGHDLLAAVLRYRPVSEAAWQEVPMEPRVNDAWAGRFSVERLEPYEYTIEAWVDHFASWQDEVRKKYQAGQDVESELLEGAALIEGAAGRAVVPDHGWLTEIAFLLKSQAVQGERVERGLSPDLTALMNRYPDRSQSSHYPQALQVIVERIRARYGAWYEMFPRSTGSGPKQSGTFRDAARHLSYIAEMGFDVVYLPPIHPIGLTHRKGPNNTLAAGPDDPGSPWAIGGPEGGHKAVHPDLGTLEDFDFFVAEASRHGLEVALDIAFQCSPDHPYVREHPEWFRHRPDGSIKYAENPPKKYQDIYPLNFESPAWESLWHELKDVIIFWAARGVRVFRVDNPHTKPFCFWEWVIAEVRKSFPDAVFLAEAFTRPKIMHALGKAGFSQSYTYFTWRNTKRELTEYVTALTRSGVREFFRPNFFANTPDILPEFLQFGGRPAFLSRLVLAATLGASYGIYSGYELCENEAIPGTEEYHQSEKFQIRHRDWNRAESLREYIALVNRIRRENPALHTSKGLDFYPVDNEQLLFFGKTTPNHDNIILVVINLDPHHMHDGWVEVPLEELGIGPSEVYQVHDLIGEGRYLWQGRRNYVRLDPAESPAQIYRLRRKVRSERDFEYFM